MATYYNQLLQLMRIGLGISDEPVVIPNEAAWHWIYTESKWQSILGVVFEGVNRNSKYSKPSIQLVLKWLMESEQLKKINAKFDQEAKRLTELFDGDGVLSVILKGQGNELLYPVKGCRSPGDIDIYLEGGKEKVINLLEAHHMLFGDEIITYHHVEYVQKINGISLEVHFRPSSGLLWWRNNRRLQQILVEEIRKSPMSERGFRVPTPKFNILMQLAHIHRHFHEGGVGLRQVSDFYFVLRHSTASDRLEAGAVICHLGLKGIASALMWVYQQQYNLGEEFMIAQPNAKLGMFLLQDICKGGNFGQHVWKESDNFLATAFHRRFRALSLMRFSVSETIGEEWSHILYVIRKLRGKVQED